MPAEDQSQNGNPPWWIAGTHSGQSCTMGDSGHSHCGICHSATFTVNAADWEIGEPDGIRTHDPLIKSQVEKAGEPLMAFPMALAVALSVAFPFALTPNLHNVVRARELRLSRAPPRRC